MAIYYIYILECNNGAFYTGYTTNIKRRYQEHLQGSPKCKYTRAFPPKQLVACWQINSTLSHTLKIEALIKKLQRSKKLQLIHFPEQLLAQCQHITDAIFPFHFQHQQQPT
ncbi:GIY-YIG nuclease superfamily protein [Piscirickettsia salmonis]|uniref:GIY-YIG nuclease family protein n=1 Tax=Piscirickettsia salmonis TaxID=1238 RepID=UPI0012B8DBBB|nr:GIY-YIG nuclease family protein [Piscirickettsia salmonis]QGP51171.1 GIY-YIG nuclease superfamily protein [Piscirickettsia salmonis]QGP53657.1 GIY-YIG nuclease superfamily protein [Piscirickettsia salmonis]QGP60434.1 GIY-YIG nuclease superfamily protein [Piscirickettsia salmonis]QGP63223.1 GIY-YIG nuclease superfamily protein [Piscirickettsia salmonis]